MPTINLKMYFYSNCQIQEFDNSLQQARLVMVWRVPVTQMDHTYARCFAWQFLDKVGHQG